MINCDDGSKSVRIKRTQFPLTPAYSFTSYKAQGATLNKVIIDLDKHNNRSYDFAFVYVSLSRVRSLKDLLILRSFPKDILKIKLSDDLILEMKRLENLEQETLKNISEILSFKLKILLIKY